MALALAAPVWSAVCTAPAMAMPARKQGRRLDLATWQGTTTWLATVSLASALVVGLVQGQVYAAGLVVLPVAATTVLVLVLLLRIAVQRHEAEHRAQEAQVAAAQREAELNQQRFSAAFTHAAIGMAIVRPDGTHAAGQPGAVQRCWAASAGACWASRFDDAAARRRRAPCSHRRARRPRGPAPTADAFSMELRCAAQRRASRLWVVAALQPVHRPGRRRATA